MKCGIFRIAGFQKRGIPASLLKQLAEYFDETEENIRKCYSTHKAELASNGAVNLTPTQPSERLTGKNITSVGSRHGQLAGVHNMISECYYSQGLYIESYYTERYNYNVNTYRRRKL